MDIIGIFGAGPVIFTTAIVSSVIVIISWKIFKQYDEKDVTLKWVVGSSTYKFKDSWATTFTGVGAILGIAISKNSALIPDTSENLYLALNLFFGILILFAPLFFKSLSKSGSKFDAAKAETSVFYYGYVWAFLFAVGITLWAVLSELLAMLSLLTLLTLESVSFLSWLISIFIVISIVIMLRHALVSIPVTLSYQSSKKPPSSPPSSGSGTDDTDPTGPEELSLIISTQVWTFNKMKKAEYDNNGLEFYNVTQSWSLL